MVVHSTGDCDEHVAHGRNRDLPPNLLLHLDDIQQWTVSYLSDPIVQRVSITPKLGP